MASCTESEFRLTTTVLTRNISVLSEQFILMQSQLQFSVLSNIPTLFAAVMSNARKFSPL
jgi:hypothetical protein